MVLRAKQLKKGTSQAKITKIEKNVGVGIDKNMNI